MSRLSSAHNASLGSAAARHLTASSAARSSERTRRSDITQADEVRSGSLRGPRGGVSEDRAVKLGRRRGVIAEPKESFCHLGGVSARIEKTDPLIPPGPDGDAIRTRMLSHMLK